MMYKCPPECLPHNPDHCHKSYPVKFCPIHSIEFPIEDHNCPTCAAYIAAGL